MSILRMLLREITRRKLNFFLALAAVTAAVGVFVWLTASANISKDESRRLMKTLGFNLLILPGDMKISDYWERKPAAMDKDMPEEYVLRLSKMEDLVADHLVGKLVKAVGWRDQSARLTGLRQELGVEGKKKKKPMSYNIPRGEVYMGYRLALESKVKKGESVEILGRSFKVSKILKEKGTVDDTRIYMALVDLQELLNKPGRINAIEALGCKCKSGKVLDVLRRQMTERLPDVQVLERDSLASVRLKARREKDKQLAVVFPVVFLVCGLWIGILFFLNVRARRREIGILRAVGVGGGRIAFLFVGKALILGVLGAALGFGLGALLTYELGRDVFELAKVQFKFISPLLPWAFAVAPAIALLAAALPTLNAVTLDPALALHDE